MGYLVERSGGAPIVVRPIAEGIEIGRAHDDGKGWRNFEIPWGEGSPETAIVEFRSSSEWIGSRHLCFESDTR